MDMFKVVSWFVLVIAWIAVVVWALIFKPLGLAFGLAILAVMTWVGWGIVLHHVLGVRRRVAAHLGMNLRDASLQQKRIGHSRITDLRRALEHLLDSKAETGQRRYGLQLSAYQSSISVVQSDNASVAPLKWTACEISPTRFESYPTNAVYLLQLGDTPVAVMVHSNDDMQMQYLEDEHYTAGAGGSIEVLARNLEDGTAALNAILGEASAQSIYRGMMLHVSPSAPGVNVQAIRVADRPVVQRERIVLPPTLFDALHRSTAARLQHSRLLQRHGHSARTGILLYGAPGTGKTMVTKHLIGVCDNYTAIVPTGMNVETIREAFQLATYLYPAIVVFEDVDLLAEKRESNINVTALQELMNEMDGLASGAEVIVLMTTNRPEVLEPALASRPGRVSQAIRFPLPDAALRAQLLQNFCSHADTEQVDLQQWIDRTDAASAVSF